MNQNITIEFKVPETKEEYARTRRLTFFEGSVTVRVDDEIGNSFSESMPEDVFWSRLGVF